MNIKRIILSLLLVFLVSPMCGLAQQEETAADVKKDNPAQTDQTTNEDGAVELSVIDKMKDPFVSFIPGKDDYVEPVEDQRLAWQQVTPDFTGGGGSGSAYYGTDSASYFDSTGLTVTGLVWGGDEPKAIINGEIYGIGDTINDAQIIEITKEGIKVSYQGTEHLLKRDQLLSN